MELLAANLVLVRSVESMESGKGIFVVADVIVKGAKALVSEMPQLL